VNPVDPVKKSSRTGAIKIYRRTKFLMENVTLKMCVLLAGVLLLGAAGHSENLIVNGSFESGPDGALKLPSVIAGWRVFAVVPEECKIERVCDPSKASDGACFLSVSSAKNGPGGIGVDTTFQSDGSVFLQRGETVTVSFDARRDSGPDRSLYVQVRAVSPDDDSAFEEIASDYFSLKDRWTRYSCTFTPQKQETSRFYIAFRGWKGDQDRAVQTVHIDRVELRKGSDSASTGPVYLLYPAPLAATAGWHEKTIE
jgi:hypothetical protein